MNSNSWDRSFDADGWTEELRRELGEADGNGRVGQRLVSETERVRVWSILLKPGERLGFHKHVLDYFWTAVTPGRARSRHHDGRITEVAYKSGDTKYMTFSQGEFMIHDLQNVGPSNLIFTTVEFLDSANSPLPVGG
jgi:beta-alanine degradation protein BauB